MGLRRSRSIWGLTKRKSASGPRRWGLRSRQKNRFADRPRRTRGRSGMCVSLSRSGSTISRRRRSLRPSVVRPRASMANAAGSGLACETGNGLQNAQSTNAGRPLCRGSRLRRQRDRREALQSDARPLPVVPADRPARAVSGRGQMGAWPGRGKRRAVFDSRLRRLKGPGDRKAHAGRIRRAPDRSRRSTTGFRACRSFAIVAT